MFVNYIIENIEKVKSDCIRPIKSKKPHYIHRAFFLELCKPYKYLLLLYFACNNQILIKHLMSQDMLLLEKVFLSWEKNK